MATAAPAALQRSASRTVGRAPVVRAWEAQCDEATVDTTTAARAMTIVRRTWMLNRATSSPPPSATPASTTGPSNIQTSMALARPRRRSRHTGVPTGAAPASAA